MTRRARLGDRRDPGRDHRRGGAVLPRPGCAAAGRRRGAGCSPTRSRYVRPAPGLAVLPGLAIVLVALAFNLLGDGLRDALDPRTTR